jgi:quinol-cytochrome oxidoreductase complex cytochrome b subunit
VANKCVIPARDTFRFSDGQPKRFQFETFEKPALYPLEMTLSESPRFVGRFLSSHFAPRCSAAAFVIVLHLFLLFPRNRIKKPWNQRELNKIPFNVFHFTLKGAFGFIIFLIIFIFIILQYRSIFSHPDNFTGTNPLLQSTINICALRSTVLIITD